MSEESTIWIIAEEITESNSVTGAKVASMLAVP